MVHRRGVRHACHLVVFGRLRLLIVLVKDLDSFVVFAAVECDTRSQVRIEALGLH